MLAEFHAATDGWRWADSANWLSDRPLRDWYGVASDANGRVTGLYLYDNRLSGPIPTSLGSLASLETLSLLQNQLTGAIPPELGRLGSLESLILDRNQLIGDIPPNWAD